jgi:hypothetical protein
MLQFMTSYTIGALSFFVLISLLLFSATVAATDQLVALRARA